jgi:hypothetical protein
VGARRFRRAANGLIAFLTLWPAAGLAQAPRAGIVTTLKGSATATRVALPEPVVLKFKDDVFLQDRIATGEQSVARLLLGGKAVVTIRERSSLTITEVPDHATLSLQSGKMALAVAREKMRAGEVIDIRTPNAIAAVRGTVLVVDTETPAAEPGAPAPASVSNIYVLSDPTGHGVLLRLLDPLTGAPIGAPITLGALQSYSTATGRIASIPPDQVRSIISGLQADPPHVAPVNTGAIVGVQVGEAYADAGSAIGNPGWLQGPLPRSTLAGAEAPAGVCTSCPPPILPGNSKTLQSEPEPHSTFCSTCQF